MAKNHDELIPEAEAVEKEAEELEEEQEQLLASLEEPKRVLREIAGLPPSVTRARPHERDRH